MTGYGSWLACNGTYCWLFISQGVPFILVLSFLLNYRIIKELTMEQVLRETLASYEEDLIAFTKALIAIPSENPPGVAYRACADLLAQKLAEIGLEYTLLESSAPAAPFSQSSEPGYCLLSSYGPGENILYFHGHYDVVPASDPAQFQPYVKGSDLFGRGSSDMKSGLAAMIGAVQAIKVSGITLRGKIGLTIVPDEETGGQRGSQ